MDLRTALLFPGQGAYRPGLFGASSGHARERASGTTLSERREPSARDLLEAVDAVAAEFGRDAVSPLLNDPDAPDGHRLAASDPFALQLAIYATALAYAADAARSRRPDVVLGHSMGEIAAAVHAGFFGVDDGARIVAHRARALDQMATGTGGMLALRLSIRRATALLAAAELPGTRVAVVNAPRHVVVSGPEADLGVVAALADVMRAPAVRLPAPYPFHNPLLAPAQRAFAAAIEGIAQRPPTGRMYSPALGELTTVHTDIKAMLVAQLTSPVDFLAAIRDLQTYGLETVVECGRAGLSELVGATIACTAETADRGPSEPPHDPEPVPATTRTEVAAVPVEAPEAGDILQTLQEIYAGRLGYPIEAMDPDADLEGDLGIDSLKRMEILGSLIDRFGLQHAVDDTRFVLQSTLNGLAQLIAETGHNGAALNHAGRPAPTDA